MSYILGVDLGTTFTAAAVARDGRVEMATLGNRAASLPSVVYLEADGTTTIGEAAERKGLDAPDRLAREFKRRVGDPTPLLVGGAPMAADVLMGRLLAAVTGAVADREGAPPDHVVVTHPANWGPYKTDLLTNAARLAGVESVTLATEPVAAATYYASTERVPDGTVVAVYDLGGGTFDAAVLRKTTGGFEVLGQPEGIERLGGIDLDAAVLAHVDRTLGGAVADIDLDDPTAVAAAARLRRECVEAKEALSEDTEANISVFLPEHNERVRLTRGELEDMLRPSLLETTRCLDRAIQSAGLTAADVDRVLLVGGSSRIPLVAELVGSELGRPVAVDAHPKHAVALGAALIGAEVTSGDHTSAPSLDAGTEPDQPTALTTPAAPAPAEVAPTVDPAVATDAAPAAASAAAVTGAAAGKPPAATPSPASAAPSSPEPVEAASRSRTGLLVGIGVAVVLVVVGVVAVFALRGSSTTTAASTTTTAAVAQNPLQLVSFDLTKTNGVCKASWSFDGSFASGDQLWLLWQGQPVAKGDAVTKATQTAGGGVQYDSLAWVRNNQVLQTWTPTSGSC